LLLRTAITTLTSIDNAMTTTIPAKFGWNSKASAPFSVPAVAVKRPGRVAGEPVEMAITLVTTHRMNARANPTATQPRAAPTIFDVLFIEGNSKSSGANPIHCRPGATLLAVTEPASMSSYFLELA
jgi:hypothetical protein